MTEEYSYIDWLWDEYTPGSIVELSHHIGPIIKQWQKVPIRILPNHDEIMKYFQDVTLYYNGQYNIYKYCLSDTNELLSDEEVVLISTIWYFGYIQGLIPTTTNILFANNVIKKYELSVSKMHEYLSDIGFLVPANI